MSGIEDIEAVSVLPDRLAAAEFNRAELRTILGKGTDPARREGARDSFNWIAAYLCEEIGYPENEVVEWFREGKRGLDWKRPLRVWGEEDGPERIFEYAQEVKKQIDEDLAEERPETDMERAHRLGNHAIEVVRNAFWVAGLNVGPGPELAVPGPTHMSFVRGTTNGRLIARWKGNMEMEDWRITLEDDTQVASYFVVRVRPRLDQPPVIFQTGIGRHSKTDSSDFALDTDIDGRPPSVGDVASFVVPLASEVKNGSLDLISA